PVWGLNEQTLFQACSPCRSKDRAKLKISLLINCLFDRGIKIKRITPSKCRWCATAIVNESSSAG
ncbi:MAG: hypothetical protein AAF446_06315, partial [Pseudomonadota bacterium]